jgi:hypothetical protein
MKILWMTWKDGEHPNAGGAESLNEGLAARMYESGHEIIFLVAGFKGCAKSKEFNGCTIYRLGNRFTVYWKAYQFYKENFIGWADVVIDEMNTIPFFCKIYVKERAVILSYQLCREIWFYLMIFRLILLVYFILGIYFCFVSVSYFLYLSVFSL